MEIPADYTQDFGNFVAGKASGIYEYECEMYGISAPRNNLNPGL